jgi:UDP-GlcNAc:undecaprenyl-phosphate/decaprenyl-phosphate GlcNAc-1-phosphate transferase
MLVLLLAGACSLVASLALTPFFRDFFAFLEMVDQPDGRRKVHRRPIPRVGGIPIAISYFVTLMAALIAGSSGRHFLTGSGSSLDLLWRLLPALFIVFLTGLIDDFRGLTPLQKIGGQFLAAGCAVAVGVRFPPVAGHLAAPYWNIALSILWLVFCANAFNLIDGLDGLASGIAFLGAGGLLMTRVVHPHPALALAVVPFLGALLGFLYYNFNPASVFLGDCGSLLIGFLFGCFGLIWSQQAASGWGSFAPLMAVAVPAADVAISIARRFLRRQPIFRADRNHIHHRLLSLGLTPRDAALILYGVSALGVGLAVVQTIVHPRTATVLLALFAIGAYWGVRKLGYIEFRSLGNFLLGGTFRAVLRMRICLHEYEQALSAAGTSKECWTAVSEACRAAGFQYVSLEVQGDRFEWARETEPGMHASRMVIPLLDGQIVFVQEGRVPATSMWIAPIVQALEEKLRMEQRAGKTVAPGKPVDGLAAIPMAAAH